MKKIILLFVIFPLYLYSQTSLDSNVTKEVVVSKDSNSSDESLLAKPIPEDDIIVVKDNSGLSDDAVRQIAKNRDKEQKKISIDKVVKAIDHKGDVDLSKLQKRWEEQSPTPLKYDWVQTDSGEWFKGEIKAMYDDKLEFDSDEVGLYEFDFEDVVRIKSYHIISVNIENLASFPGILRLKGDKVTIIQGDNKYEFDRKDIVSLALNGTKESDFWSGKITINLDLRSGNVQQYDYNVKANVKRRTSDSRLFLDYLGRISSKKGSETANDHRINQKYDIYLSRHFFWTPFFSEYYTDIYKNIDTQLTGGVGIGYTVADTKKVDWSFSAGPAAIYTRFVSVQDGVSDSQFSPALELSTKLEYEINKITDFTFDYKLTYTNESSGSYKHHMIVSFENELLSWLDFDVTGIWDYTANPERNSDNEVAKPDDYQLLLGFGIEF